MERYVAIKRIVYTINLGGYDKVIENHHTNTDWEYYLITDDWNLKSKFWNVIYVLGGSNSKRQSRQYKWLPHRLFDTEISLYIDANIRILTDLNKLVDSYLDGGIAMYGHRVRDCAYSEAMVCRQAGLDSPKIIDRQVKRYREAGYPNHNGLHEGTIILRRHTEKINRLNEFVFNEIRRGSYRDQIAFDYSAWKLGVKVKDFKGMIKLYPEAREVIENYYGYEIDYSNSYFEMEPHV